MGNQSYTMPEIEELTPVTGKAPKESARQPKAISTPVTTGNTNDVSKAAVEAPEDPLHIEYGAKHMWNDDHTDLEDLIKQRIARNLQFVAGERSYVNDKEMELEQITFINTFMNAVNNKDYELARLFMLEMIRQMRPMYPVLQVIPIFRFQERIRQFAPRFDFQGFQSVYTNLVDIAGHWPTRRVYCRGRDFRYMIQYFNNQNAKHNVYTFFQNMHAHKL